MPQVRSGRSPKSARRRPAEIRREGKLPKLWQKRLDELIELKKHNGLTVGQEQELSEALQYVDDQSILMLKRGLLRQQVADSLSAALKAVDALADLNLLEQEAV